MKGGQVHEAGDGKITKRKHRRDKTYSTFVVKLALKHDKKLIEDRKQELHLGNFDRIPSLKGGQSATTGKGSVSNMDRLNFARGIFADAWRRMCGGYSSSHANISFLIPCSELSRQIDRGHIYVWRYNF